MKLLKLIALVGITAFFAACSSSKSAKKSETKQEIVTPATPAAPVNILQVDPHLQNGKTINLKVGEKFDVVFLRECIGCAEVWRITSIDNDKMGKMEDTYRNGPAPGMMGGSQDHIFHFMAKDKGVSNITFVYFKDTRTITFDVK